ncbi:DUF1461 domain-containing protein [Candidatus Woesearchaeota archaeon]|nr:DUF1461 domain-containing protein [Candidatus Woesearchaeota archaeon]
MKCDGLKIIFWIFIFLFILLSSYEIVLRTNSYTIEQEKWLNYFAGGNNADGEYTSLEFSHMEDVKRVMNGVDYIFYICLILVLGVGLYYKKDKKLLINLSYYGGLVSVGGIVLLLLIILVSFNFFFAVFHQIFFPQGNWQFPANSLLIQTFPLDFFTGLSVKIFLLALVLGLVLWGAGYYLRKKIKFR